MPISLRRVRVTDLIEMQNANLHCLPENYHMWYWLYHYLLSPQNAHVAVNPNGKVLAYVLGKIDDEEKKSKVPPPPHGHITSVATFSRNRKLGLATKLMAYTHRSMRECYVTDHVDLNVRETNRAAHHLYEQTLGYKFVKCEDHYYADGENGWIMRYFYPENYNEQNHIKWPPKANNKS